MAFNKKTWVDRLVQYAGRRTLTKSNGSTEVVTVSRNEGVITAEGDSFSAATMNDLEDRIANAFQDNTYSSKAAASGGTALSLVTTGEKYTWNNKYSKPSGGIPATDIASGVIPTSLPANGGTASNVSGTVAIANGGTGATTASDARTNLGLGGAAVKAVDTSISTASTSANLPTSAAVASFVEGKGYKTTDNNTTYTLTQDATDGHKITLTPSSGTATTITIPDNNTKNTAGSTDSSSKLFLIGATSQAANPQTYSQDTAYVGTDGYLYSNSKKVFGATEVTGTLAAGNTSLALSNSAITTSSTIDVYVGTYGVAPTGMTVVAGKVTLTFSAQTAALSVKIRVS